MNRRKFAKTILNKNDNNFVICIDTFEGLKSAISTHLFWTLLAVWQQKNRLSMLTYLQNQLDEIEFSQFY